MLTNGRLNFFLSTQPYYFNPVLLAFHLTLSLVFHVVCGFAALFSGIVAMLTQKGGLRHRFWGRIFVFSMLGVSLTAVHIALFRHHLFLLFIGVFAAYMNFSGYRSVRNKSLTPTFWDWVVLVVAGVNGFLMVFTFQIILLVFGGLSLGLVIQDIRFYWLLQTGRKLNVRQWLLRHIGMMLGTYISTATAFIVVNIREFNPPWLPWLLPTFLGVPMILYWLRKAGSTNQ